MARGRYTAVEMLLGSHDGFIPFPKAFNIFLYNVTKKVEWAKFQRRF